ncbi:hypothetical protein SAMN06295912_11655 [Sphingomonas laterariae]|uniref:Uncharacterized protein n=1 Tax=Edaphosphingomonas laterariae TaxID=861865 RepID=A0A239HEQ5_9SPHN|nr:hypothetical protein [Sphingomonas laterariae]SNS79293.1 hypothetical protein SAMN06295912_11655 [Sphingomonas laterariae]
MRRFALSILAATSLAVMAGQAMAATAAVQPGTSPAAKLSPSARMGATMTNSSHASGNGLGIAMLVLVAAGAIWGAYEMIDGDGDGDDEPVSN